jgi:polyphosphate kinase 2 (PPK2 family)
MGKKSEKEDEAYAEAMHKVQVELVRFHKHVIKGEQKVLVILEGRDAAGKDGTAKRIIEHLSPRESRIVALKRTHSVFAPWTVVKADDKRATRLNVIRDLLSRCSYSGKRHGEYPDPNKVYFFDETLHTRGVIAP